MNEPSDRDAIFTGDPAVDVPQFPSNPHMRELAATLPAGRALDLGCGPGTFAVELAEQGWEVRGVDSSPKALESAKQHATDRGVDVAFELGDVAYWIPLGIYDLVTSSHALPPPDHEARRAVAVAAAPVKPEGWLAITEWAPAAAETLGFAASDLLSRTDIVAELPGFEIVRSEEISAPRPDGDGEAPALIVVAQRHPR